MVEVLEDRMADMIARNRTLEVAHEYAAKEALLEHARMGRPVASWRDGSVVMVTPAEIFSRYGFDEFGRPLPDSDSTTGETATRS
jgi:hypothetical protein